MVNVALGVLARSWAAPGDLVEHASRIQTTLLAAGSSVLVNNLPAAVLLSADRVPHPQALLIGLNLGPNLAVTGSLSAFLWMQAARQAQSPTSAWAFTRRGLLLVPLALGAALLAGGG